MSYDENNAKLTSPGMTFFAALAVIALVGISAAKAWDVVSKGNTTSAHNDFVPPAQRATTPWNNVDWQTSLPTIAGDETAMANDPNGLSNIETNIASALLTSYTALADIGLYTPEAGKEIAEDIASSLKARVTYRPYTELDIKTDQDASYDRMLSYRNDLRIALEPLLENPGYEFALFASYIESKDPVYTERLRATSQNYQKAISNLVDLTVPTESSMYHLGILNALSEFGAVVQAMAEHGDDAFAAAALLQSYNSSEARLLTAFNDLATYQRTKPL